MLDYLDAALDTTAEPNSAAAYFFYHGAAMVLAARTDPADRGGRRPRARAPADPGAREPSPSTSSRTCSPPATSRGPGATSPSARGRTTSTTATGLEIRSWDGTETVLFGDAFLKPDGLERAAQAVRTSLEQVLDAVDAEGTPARIAALASPIRPRTRSPAATASAPRDRRPTGTSPMPSSPGSPPSPCGCRFRFAAPGPARCRESTARSGPTWRSSREARSRAPAEATTVWTREGSLIDSLSLGLRFGLGLEELLTDSGDGLIFLEGGVAMSSAEPTDCPECEGGGATSFRACPRARESRRRFRAPFWLVPGDLILAAPILLLTAPQKFHGDGGGRRDRRPDPLAAPLPHAGRLVPAHARAAKSGRRSSATPAGSTSSSRSTANEEPIDRRLQIGRRRDPDPRVPSRSAPTARSRRSSLRFQFGAGFDKPLFGDSPRSARSAGPRSADPLLRLLPAGLRGAPLPLVNIGSSARAPAEGNLDAGQLVPGDRPARGARRLRGYGGVMEPRAAEPPRPADAVGVVLGAAREPWVNDRAATHRFGACGGCDSCRSPCSRSSCAPRRC